MNEPQTTLPAPTPRKPNHVRPIAITLASALVMSAIAVGVAEKRGEQIGAQHGAAVQLANDNTQMTNMRALLRDVTVQFNNQTGVPLAGHCTEPQMEGLPPRPVVLCTLSRLDRPLGLQVLAAN